MSKITMYVGAASSISTVVLVIVTIWYAILTKRILKSNESLVKQNIMPLLYISPPIYHPRGGGVTFMTQVSNIGRGPALDIELSGLPEELISPQIINFMKADSGKELYFNDITKEMALKIRPSGGQDDFSQFHIILKYKDMEGNKYKVSWPTE